MGCDMCGAKTTLYYTKVEQVEMQLCDTCKIYGEVSRPVHETNSNSSYFSQKRQAVKQTLSSEQEVGIVEGYAKKIRQAREAKNLTQEQLAQQIGIKLSQLHKFESNVHEPDIATAQKLEKMLKIRLQTTLEQKDVPQVEERAGFTIADMIKKKK